MQIDVFNSAVTHSLSAAHRAERATAKKQSHDERKAAEKSCPGDLLQQSLANILAYSPLTSEVSGKEGGY